MAGIKYLIIDIKRRPPKDDCTVFLMIDRLTSKYCFVNMDSQACMFMSFQLSVRSVRRSKEQERSNIF